LRGREKARERGYELTMHMDAHTILKPLQLKEALVDVKSNNTEEDVHCLA
jgi:hypothetical protein